MVSPIGLTKIQNIVKVSNDAFTVMRSMRFVGNIYKLFGNINVGDVASVESDNDTTKLLDMYLSHLSVYGMMVLHERNQLKDTCN